MAWLHGFRRLRVRWERRDDIHEAFLGLATCLITHRHGQRLGQDLLGRNWRDSPRWAADGDLEPSACVQGAQSTTSLERQSTAGPSRRTGATSGRTLRASRTRGG
ncbi:hypothetical protein ACFYWO_14075 [Streptomyces sp. NPDC002932]|uniref:hypothetical protein n=1 Tax=Streptomyces sp. NPDC002932 TaxID=3364672 RepID=UPI0036ADE861